MVWQQKMYKIFEISTRGLGGTQLVNALEATWIIAQCQSFLANRKQTLRFYCRRSVRQQSLGQSKSFVCFGFLNFLRSECANGFSRSGNWFLRFFFFFFKLGRHSARANRDFERKMKRHTTNIATKKKTEDKPAPFPFPSSSPPSARVLDKILHNKYNFMFRIEYRRMHKNSYPTHFIRLCVSIFATSPESLATPIPCLPAIERIARKTKNEKIYNMGITLCVGWRWIWILCII